MRFTVAKLFRIVELSKGRIGELANLRNREAENRNMKIVENITNWRIDELAKELLLPYINFLLSFFNNFADDVEGAIISFSKFYEVFHLVGLYRKQ